MQGVNIEALVAQIRREHLAGPPAAPDHLARGRELGLPDDLLHFYQLTDGAYLYGSDEYGDFHRDGRWWQWQILPLDSVRPVADRFVSAYRPLWERARHWLAVVDVLDSNYLAISTEPGHAGEAIDCFHETVGMPGYNRIVARSFTELLTELLRSPEAFWLSGDRPDYGSY
jgi:hypothetical protein